MERSTLSIIRIADRSNSSYLQSVENKSAARSRLRVKWGGAKKGGGVKTPLERPNLLWFPAKCIFIWPYFSSGRETSE